MALEAKTSSQQLGLEKIREVKMSRSVFTRFVSKLMEEHRARASSLALCLGDSQQLSLYQGDVLDKLIEDPSRSVTNPPSGG